MKKVSLSNQLKIIVEDMNPQWLGTFSLVLIDGVYKQEALFLCPFLKAYIDSYDHIIDNSNLD